MDCEFCTKTTNVEEIRNFKGNSGNYFSICTKCYWGIECKPYCKHCCQVYTDLKQHCKTDIHKKYKSEDNPIEMSNDEKVKFKKKGPYLKTKQLRIDLLEEIRK